MTDTPPKPKRKRWRWLPVRVLVLFVAVQLVSSWWPGADPRYVGNWIVRDATSNALQANSGSSLTFYPNGEATHEFSDLQPDDHLKWFVERDELVLIYLPIGWYSPWRAAFDSIARVMGMSCRAEVRYRIIANGPEELKVQEVTSGRSQVWNRTP